MTTQFCQSCSMPLVDDSQLGTDVNGSLNKDYCKYCYENGAFTNPDCTLEEMIEICVPYVMENGMSEEEARQLMKNTVPFLKRWRTDQDELPSFEPVRYERLNAFSLQSLITKRTSNKQEMSGNGEIPQAWQQVMSQSNAEQPSSEGSTAETNAGTDASNEGTQPPLYAVYHQYENEILGEYNFTIAVPEQNTGAAATNNAGTAATNDVNSSNAANPVQSEAYLILPEAEYAVFRTRSGPVMEVVAEAWHGIWKWQSETDRKRTYSGDFELYHADKVINGVGEVEIYIAVERA
ncbi:zinc ribbon domain-containing protein [Paenibacillus sp. SC116]|uniref:zinc ribbon domain-containing protein n=1 Tax=Paenibacillus sp. SC116 TaxID=2968986 RepID=UPI00215A4149|nr:zinc ribbon domain-containing protein [Paenibacillus sp. SC116]MCR8844096.1 zinc ribbon domain-containing protein [Paenibacillus sp. SC116]